MVAKSAAVVAGDASRVNLVATGGGASLPIIDDILENGVDYQGKHVAFAASDPISAGDQERYPDLVEPYAQVAVVRVVLCRHCQNQEVVSRRD